MAKLVDGCGDRHRIGLVGDRPIMDPRLETSVPFVIRRSKRSNRVFLHWVFDNERRAKKAQNLDRIRDALFAKDRLMGILGDGEPSAFLPRPCRTREFVAKVNEVMGEKVAQ
jgi:hypothetical protein